MYKFNVVLTCLLLFLISFAMANLQHATFAEETKPASDTVSPIDYVQDHNYMSGYPDGKFHPDKPVTRAELAHILNKAFKLDVRDPSGKNIDSVKDPIDVPENHWARYDIKVAVSRGIMKGYGSNRFLPNRTINRAEGYAIIGNAYGVFQFDKETIDELLSHYPDSKSLPTWSVKAVTTCLHEGFVTLKKTDGYIQPFKPLTRYDVAFALTKHFSANNTPFYAKPGYDEAKQTQTKPEIPKPAN